MVAPRPPRARTKGPSRLSDVSRAPAVHRLNTVPPLPLGYARNAGLMAVLLMLGRAEKSQGPVGASATPCSVASTCHREPFS